MHTPFHRDFAEAQARHRRHYFSVRAKFTVALIVAGAWTTLSVFLASAWMRDLGELTHPLLALWVITFIAFIPGFMNAFLAATLVMDRRPARRKFTDYPGVSILIAAYNEASGIRATLESIVGLHYEGQIEALVINDGSTDATASQVKRAIEDLSAPENISIHLLDFEENRGKAYALDSGLAVAKHDIICTIDGDSRLRSDSLRQIVERMLSDPPETMAVAGAVLVGNSRETLITAAQEWDYFLGIAAVKRMQSMYHGTLVAQGAFSIYRREALEAVGGWPKTVGEDIVMTWSMLEHGYRVGYAEDAVVFTDAPASFMQFYRQRRRWSRGLVEALESHKRLLFKRRLSTLFVWWNMLFLPLDLTYTFIFLPGLAAAILGYFWIAGPLTLLLLPLALVWTGITFTVQWKMFRGQGLRVRRNILGFFFYFLVYAFVMQPVCLLGYISELTRQKKAWGTK